MYVYVCLGMPCRWASLDCKKVCLGMPMPIVYLCVRVSRGASAEDWKETGEVSVMP